MRYHALACDYDGTIAWNGHVNTATIRALEDLRKSGRRLILVTGRELGDLEQVFPRLDLFDVVVAENGALLHCPATQKQRLLSEPPPDRFVNELIKRQVPLSAGRVIVATRRPHETAVVEVIRDLGLELQIIFNKGAVMVLPSGVNKATGLNTALQELGLSAHNVVGVGDAENDHAFLALCECSVAVSNALEALKKQADWVTPSGNGAGTVELVETLIATDLNFLEERAAHRLSLGATSNGSGVWIQPYSTNVLIAGAAGSGKSVLAAGFLERLHEHGYQFLVIDPNGDYMGLTFGVPLGDAQQPPSIPRVLDLLSRPDQNAIVNLSGVDLDERPAFCDALWPRVQELQQKTGRPHWIVVDESHHPSAMRGQLIVAREPDRVSREVLSRVDLVVAVGERPAVIIEAFCKVMGQPACPVVSAQIQPGQGIAWFRHSTEAPRVFDIQSPESEWPVNLGKF